MGFNGALLIGQGIPGSQGAGSHQGTAQQFAPTVPSNQHLAASGTTAVGGAMRVSSEDLSFSIGGESRSLPS